MSELRQRIEELEEEKKLRETAASNKAENENKIRQERIEIVRKLLLPFQEALQFLVVGHQHEYQLENGQRLLIRRLSEGRLMMMVTSDPNKMMPEGHFHKQEQQISTPDVQSWQVVTFGSMSPMYDNKPGAVDGVFYYSREVLDKMSSGLQKETWAGASVGLDVSDIRTMDINGLNKVINDLGTITKLPDELLSQISAAKEKAQTS